MVVGTIALCVWAPLYTRVTQARALQLHLAADQLDDHCTSVLPAVHHVASGISRNMHSDARQCLHRLPCSCCGICLRHQHILGLCMHCNACLVRFACGQRAGLQSPCTAPKQAVHATLQMCPASHFSMLKLYTVRYVLHCSTRISDVCSALLCCSLGTLCGWFCQGLLLCNVACCYAMSHTM